MVYDWIEGEDFGYIEDFGYCVVFEVEKGEVR